MQANEVSRRQFLKAGVIAAALADAGRLPLLSAQAQAGSSIDASTGPCAVKPIRDYLRRFSPAQTELTGNGNYSLTYDIIHWDWINGRQGTFANSVLGRVAISRRSEGGRVVYEVTRRTRIGGVDNFLEARIVCEPNDLNSLREWTVSSYSKSVTGELDPLSTLAEKGQCDRGRIRIESGDHKYRFVAKHAVVTQWTVLDFLIRRSKLTSGVTFDLLQDLSLFKPNQAIAYDGVTPIRLRVGTLELHTYAQTGQGILPIHYLLDGQNRPHLVTNSILSWALLQASDRPTSVPQGPL